MLCYIEEGFVSLLSITVVHDDCMEGFVGFNSILEFIIYFSTNTAKGVIVILGCGYEWDCGVVAGFQFIKFGDW